IKEFLDEELIEYYYLLYPTHYASETFNYINHYRGDAISIIANMAIKKNPKIKYPLLERLFEHSYSIDYCEYVNNTIFKKDYSQDIEELKSIIPSQFKKKESKIESILYSLLSKKIPFKKDDINNKNFAIYYGDISPKRKEEIDKYIDSFNIKRINFSLSQKPIGLSLKDINFNFASFKGAKMLLDAFDSGADILIGVNSSNYIKSIYKYTFKHTKREVKLAIIDLEELEKVLLEYK
ncbi:MAG: hypothetical protein GXO02_02395, partial [Epsilonproteobacteria bacterium]|nr:hypothetical protein [Campylobacterota bacterium]